MARFTGHACQMNDIKDQVLLTEMPAKVYIGIPFSWGLGRFWANDTFLNFGRTWWEELPLYKIHTLPVHCTTSCLLSTRRYCCLLDQPTIANVLVPGEITCFIIVSVRFWKTLLQALQSLKTRFQQRAAYQHCAPLGQPDGDTACHLLNISLLAEGALYRKLTEYFFKHITLKMTQPFTLLLRNLKVR